VQVAHRDAGRQDGVVRVPGGQRGGRLGRQVVEFDGRHAIVDAVDDLFGHLDGRHEILIKPVAKFFNAGGDFIELDRFTAAIAFDYEHVMKVAMVSNNY
jgi:hypothetical protein